MRMRTKNFVGRTFDAVMPYETEHRAVARKAAAEGFVLLKNEDQVLPLKAGVKIGLYGAGASKTIKGGTGSGDVNERDNVNIYEGLLNAGFEVTSASWIKDYDALYMQARYDWRDAIYAKMEEMKDRVTDNLFFEAYSSCQFRVPCGNPIDEEAAVKDGADTAIFVLSRIAGENADRRDIKGDYYITDEENELIAQVCRCYKNVVLVINTGGLIDLAFTEKYPNIKSVLQFMQAGQEGGNALADVITGKVTPSGKMTDSWALDYKDYPNASFFSYKSGSVEVEEYKEGIYVGYRYFDTFDVPVRYPFGFGLSYTDFAIKTDEITVTGLKTALPKVNVTLTVTNTGDTYSGKEVPQIYVSCPQGKLTKEFRRLAGFAKTGILAPKASETMTVSFALEQLASYDEEAAAWVLDNGTYGIWVGNSIADAKIAGSIVLSETAIVTRCENICKLQRPLEEIAPDPAKLLAKTASWQAAAAELPSVKISKADILTRTVIYGEERPSRTGEAEKITERLSLDQLVALATGDPGMGQGSALGSAGQSVPGAAAETVLAAKAEGVASIVLADGPAGLRLNKTYQIKDNVIQKVAFEAALENGFLVKDAPEKVGETWYQYCTAFPVGTLLAQTWNMDLIKEVGTVVAEEMNMFEVTLWLAPGMCIHRNPLCGRNFEYYSEDPLLTGMCASAMTLGVQRIPGCGTTIKHFACNNQEDNRMGSDSVLSERTLREIYLKGFEIVVRNAQPMSIMTSYNMINGVHAANCYDTCTKAARDEWGFAGAIMTDWTTTTASTGGVCNAAGCMRAGNDMVMPGDPADHISIRNALKDGSLTIEELKRCVRNTVNVILQSNQYEEAVSYLDQFEGLDLYLTAEDK